MDLNELIEELDRRSYTGEALSLHPLEPFDVLGRAEVATDGTLFGPEPDLDGLGNSEAGDVAYKLHPFGGPNGPIHRIEWGIAESDD